jgi:hypothetical protein
VYSTVDAEYDPQVMKVRDDVSVAELKPHHFGGSGAGKQCGFSSTAPALALMFSIKNMFKKVAPAMPGTDHV